MRFTFFVLLFCIGAANCIAAFAQSSSEGTGSYFADTTITRQVDKRAELRRTMARHANDNAQVFLVRKSYDAALREINEALRMDPCCEYYYTRARVYEAMDRTELATQDWQTILGMTKMIGALEDAVEFFRKTHQLEKALASCDSSIANYAYCSVYVLRSRVNAEMGRNKEAIDDATRAYQLAFETGCDGKEEHAQLKLLLGGVEPAKPQPKTAEVKHVLDVVDALANSKKPFDTGLTAKLTGVKLREIPYENHPEYHTGSFESVGRGADQLWYFVRLERPTEIGRNMLWLVLNTRKCVVTVADVTARFGPCKYVPDRSTRCIIDPAHLTYKRPWGSLRFSFVDGGFNALNNVNMYVGDFSRD